MITSERQYAVSKKQAARFQETLEQFDARPSELHPKALKAMREGWRVSYTICWRRSPTMRGCGEARRRDPLDCNTGSTAGG